MDGFDLEATTEVRADDRERLEHLCCYLLRPPLADRRRPLVARFRGAVRLKLPRGVYDLPKGFVPRAIIDDRGALNFLLASRG